MNTLDIFLKHWRRSVLLMIAGGILGYGASFLRPPSYQATAYLTTAIDYSRTGSLEELEADRMLGIAEDILNSDGVFRQLCQERVSCDPGEIRQSVQVERTIGLWALSVFSDDAAEAVTLARGWLEAARAVLLERQTHALQAETLSLQLEGMAVCVQNAVNGNPPAVCSGKDLDTLLADIQAVSARIQQEQLLSGGISSAVVFGPLNLDHIQLRNLRTAPGLFTLLGALAGLFLSALLAILRPAKAEKISGTLQTAAAEFSDDGKDGA